jgi:elongator complex protein 3
MNPKPPAEKNSWHASHRQPIDLAAHEDLLRTILDAVRDLSDPSSEALSRILHRHTPPGGDTFSKWQLLHGYRQLCRHTGQTPDPEMVRRLRMKPIRTLSGVAPVAVLTAP